PPESTNRKRPRCSMASRAASMISEAARSASMSASVQISIRGSVIAGSYRTVPPGAICLRQLFDIHAQRKCHRPGSVEIGAQPADLLALELGQLFRSAPDDRLPARVDFDRQQPGLLPAVSAHLLQPLDDVLVSMQIVVLDDHRVWRLRLRLGFR